MSVEAIVTSIQLEEVEAEEAWAWTLLVTARGWSYSRVAAEVGEDKATVRAAVRECVEYMSDELLRRGTGLRP